MSFAFSSVKKIRIPEGTVRKITRASDNAVLWKKIAELAYHGTATALSAERHCLAATTVGNYALFGGGGYYNSNEGIFEPISTVDAYNASLTRSTPTKLSEDRYGLAATTVGNYALFGGGTWWDSDLGGFHGAPTVDAYNKSLTRSKPTALSQARTYLAATTVGNYALFGGGGYSYDGGGEADASYTTVDAYNASLTRSTPTALSQARSYHSATTVGNYALFGGGMVNSMILDAYDASLTKTTAAPWTSVTQSAATTVGNYALFAGGASGSYFNPGVMGYDASLTRNSSVSLLSVGRYALAATTVGDYALFGGGYGNNDISGVVDVYDKSLTRSTTTDLSYARAELAATTLGDYALFAGGLDVTQYPCTIVDAYIYG